MKNKQQGFVTMVLVVIILAMIGGGIYFYSNNNSIKTNQEQESSVSPTTNTTEIQSKINTKEENPIKNNTETAKVVAITSPTVIATVSVNNNVDTRFDGFFKKWVSAWNKRDADILMNTFGYADFQVANKEDDSLWHYKSYVLYKSKSVSPTAEDIATYKQYGTDVPYDTKVTGYYIVSKDGNSYNIAIINGNYKKNTEKASITQWQIYPSEYSPKVYSSLEEAKVQVSKF